MSAFLKKWTVRIVWSVLLCVISLNWNNLNINGWLTTAEGTQLAESIRNHNWQWDGMSTGYWYRGTMMVHPDTVLADVRISNERSSWSSGTSPSGLTILDRIHINSAAKERLHKMNEHRLFVALQDGKTDEDQSKADRKALIEKIRKDEADAFTSSVSAIRERYRKDREQYVIQIGKLEDELRQLKGFQQAVESKLDAKEITASPGQSASPREDDSYYKKVLERSQRQHP